MVVANELKKRIRGEVHTDVAARRAASTDASLFEVMPEIVVSPKDADDVKALVRFAKEHGGVSLTARSGGTGMDGGALGESIVVDFTKHFNRVGQVVNGEVTTQPGVFYRDFERKTLKHNRLMPSYPASREICTVGGMVANNAGGEKTLRYGKTEDYVEELKVVLADGNEYSMKPLFRTELTAKMAQDDFEGDVYRKLFALVDKNNMLLKNAKPQVHKNSAGYSLWNVWDKERQVFDPTKLFVGSQGTLGLVTDITFRLIKPEPHARMMVIFLDSFSRLGELVQTVLRYKPTTFESYDDQTLKLALRFFWEFLKRLGFQNIFTLALRSVGEALSIVRQGMPKLVLQVTFEGDDEAELHGRAEKLKEALAEFSPQYLKIIESDKEAQQFWLIRRESFNLLRHKVKGKKTAPFIDDISVPIETLSELFPQLQTLLAEYDEFMVHNIAGHIGDGNFHIIPLMDLSQEASRAVIPVLAKRLYALILEYGGSITGEHNDGIIRTPFLKQQYGEEVYRLFEETKRIFDPHSVFNPGKKVGGTLAYALAHIKKHNN